MTALRRLVRHGEHDNAAKCCVAFVCSDAFHASCNVLPGVCHMRRYPPAGSADVSDEARLLAKPDAPCIAT